MGSLNGMLVALVALALTSRAPRTVAFLDSPTVIHVPLDHPMTAQQIGVDYQVAMGRKVLAVSKIEPDGDASAERVLPRTPGRVVLPGTLQGAMGGKDWDPDGEVTQATEVSKGVYKWVGQVPKGSYDYKIARNGSWEENYGAGFAAGGGNLRLVAPSDQIVAIVVDFNRKVVLNSIDNPTDVPAPTSVPKPPKRGDEKYGVAKINLIEPITSDEVAEDIEVIHGGSKTRVYARGILEGSDYTYTGPLGAEYHVDHTTFRVWSPVSRAVYLVYSKSASNDEAHSVSLTPRGQGLWQADVPGDLNGTFYQYQFEEYDEDHSAADIYGYSASADSKWSMVVNLQATDPPDFQRQSLATFWQPVDTVIYEISVRDFTVSPSSGVDADKRGKYAGLAQTGTVAQGTTVPSGLDYLKKLGVTHVHILPVQDFLTSKRDEYTWGYATNMFNMPEETYSVTPNDPAGVIKEFKGMVSAVHKAGLNVVMDVVYNHTWPPQGEGSAFEQAVPYYYFRTNMAGVLQNESGVGNALDDDRPMARKFVRDSLMYWAKEYGIDGFRFDLLGMFSHDSVNDWSTNLHQFNPKILIYGEPWTGGGPTRFGKGKQRGMPVAVFNDNFRSAFRGELDSNEPEFIAGGDGDPFALQKSISGWIGQDGIADAPTESINYLSAHDNLTLNDRIAKSTQDPSTQLKALNLANAAVLLSQGVPFLEGGAELGRTKGGNNNSYNAGDQVNGFDWQRGLRFQDSANYLAGLIALRKAEPGFRLRTADQINSRLKVIINQPKLIVWTIDQDSMSEKYQRLFVVLNANSSSQSVQIPPGLWEVLVEGNKAGTAVLRNQEGPVDVPAMSAMVLAR